MAKKAVRNITLTFTEGTGQTATTTTFNGRLLGSVVYKGSSVEVDPIAAYGDTYFTNVPRVTKSWDDFTFTILDQGNTDPSDADLQNFTGKVVTITITPSYGDGDGADTALATPISCKMTVKNVSAGGEVQFDGDGKSTITITAVPHGPVANA